MSNESPADLDKSEDVILPPIIVRKDPAHGVFARVVSQEAEGLAEWLLDDRIPFEVDVENATRLATPGHRTFLFFKRHPDTVREDILAGGFAVETEPGTPLTETSYREPVSSLLALDTPRRGEKVDYTAFGFTSEDVPELIRMALDGELHTGPVDSPVIFAPVHAWRVLGNLRAEEAIMPLLELLQRVDDEEDDWVSEDLPMAFAAIGPAAITPIAEYAADSSHGQWSRTAAMRSLTAIAKEHPDARDECVVRLGTQLEQFLCAPEEMNAFIICELIDLRAVELAPLMEQAFAAERVDEEICGDWEDVAIDLGLKAKRERPKRPNRLTEFSERAFDRALIEPFRAELERASDIVLVSDPVPYLAPPKAGRNDPCPCGSEKKFKKCCGR